MSKYPTVNHFRTRGLHIPAPYCFILSILLTISVTSCGSLSEGTGSDDGASPASASGDDNAAAAVASLFGSPGGTSLIKAVAGEEPNCPNDPGCTCTFVAMDEGGTPSEVSDALYRDTGIYGSDNYPMEVGASDFCAQPDGTMNPGMGSDGLGRFASFELIADVEGDCTDTNGSETTLTMQVGSFGIWRNTDETETTPAYEPQIFGTFSILVDGEVSVLNCTIYLDSTETAAFADCTNEDGQAVAQAEASSCQFSTDE